MQNLGMIMRLMNRLAPGLDARALGQGDPRADRRGARLRARGPNQRAMARIFRGHPFIVVPTVVGSLSRERVMVTEFVHGHGFEALKGAPQAERDRLGEIIFRFYFGCMYRHHQFSGDPHPGNFMLLRPTAGWRSSTSGCSNGSTPGAAEFELAAQRRRSPRATARACRAPDGRVGFLARARQVHDPELILAQVRDVTWWYTEDQELELRPEIATQVMIDMSDPALAVTSPDAPGVAAAGPPLRPAHGDADARRDRASCGRAATGIGSPASGCAAIRRQPSSAGPEADFLAGSRAA